MKLNTDATYLLDQLVQTAIVAGLTKLIVEPGKVRGIDEKQTVVVLSTDNVPDLDGKQAGINRVDKLGARLNLVKAQGSLDVEATASTSNPSDIAVFDMWCGKTKTQFRCASTEAVKGVPKSLTDAAFAWELKVDGKILPVITQGVSAMGAESLTLASRDGKTMTVECVDSNKDVFSTDVPDPINFVGQGTAPASFCHSYPAKTLLNLLKEAGKTQNPVVARLCENGILSFKVNGLDFFALPR